MFWGRTRPAGRKVSYTHTQSDPHGLLRESCPQSPVRPDLLQEKPGSELLPKTTSAPLGWEGSYPQMEKGTVIRKRTKTVN